MLKLAADENLNNDILRISRATILPSLLCRRS